jgi:hypothetical protein
LFAELAVLRSFEREGWNGVWVDSFRQRYRIGLPESTTPVALPSSQEELLGRIRGRPGWPRGCWDLVLWRDEETRFVEVKRRGKDRIRRSHTVSG